MNEYFYICFWGMVGDSLGPCESNLEASQDPSLRPLGQEIGPVSYTHLTLPTIYSV